MKFEKRLMQLLWLENENIFFSWLEWNSIFTFKWSNVYARIGVFPFSVKFSRRRSKLLLFFQKWMKKKNRSNLSVGKDFVRINPKECIETNERNEKSVDWAIGNVEKTILKWKSTDRLANYRIIHRNVLIIINDLARRECNLQRKDKTL